MCGIWKEQTEICQYSGNWSISAGLVRVWYFERNLNTAWITLKNKNRNTEKWKTQNKINKNSATVTNFLIFVYPMNWIWYNTLQQHMWHMKLVPCVEAFSFRFRVCHYHPISLWLEENTWNFAMNIGPVLRIRFHLHGSSVCHSDSAIRENPSEKKRNRYTGAIRSSN